MSHQQNVLRIKIVYDALEELGSTVIFVGGATVSLYADRLGDEVRVTDDVDILIEILNYSDYAGLEEKLRSKGFTNDVESGVICRYKVKGIVVDVMPTSEEILGFANKWYVDGYIQAMTYVIDENYSISIFSPPYFLATKLEAFKDRGDNDGRWSTDFEDIVFLLNKRSTIWEEINNANEKVKKYLLAEFKALAENKYIDEWISVHLGYGEQERTYHIIGSINELLKLNKLI
jgi:predicted nucleotidyltransferase